MCFLSVPGSSNVRHVIIDLPHTETASDRAKPTQLLVLNDVIIYLGKDGVMGVGHCYE